MPHPRPFRIDRARRISPRKRNSEFVPPGQRLIGGVENKFRCVSNEIFGANHLWAHQVKNVKLRIARGLGVLILPAWLGLIQIAQCVWPRFFKYCWWYSSARQNFGAGSIWVTIGRGKRPLFSSFCFDASAAAFWSGEQKK